MKSNICFKKKGKLKNNSCFNKKEKLNNDNCFKRNSEKNELKLKIEEQKTYFFTIQSIHFFFVAEFEFAPELEDVF